MTTRPGGSESLQVLAEVRAALAAPAHQPPGPGRRRRTSAVVTTPDPADAPPRPASTHADA